MQVVIALLGLAALIAVFAGFVGLIGYLSAHSTKRPRVGPAASGTIYEMLNEDKRRALEIIVAARAEAQDPEDRDGNLPDLANPKR